MKHAALVRTILDIILFISIIQGWWYIVLPVSMLGLWLFELYGIEAVLAGIMFDALFGMNSVMGIWGYSGIITAMLLLSVKAIIKKLVR